MSAPEDRTGPPGPGAEEQLSPEQEQMLRQMEEEMRRLRVEDLLIQSVASIINLSARRIVKEDERDLDQARIGIDAVAALVDLLEPDAQHEIKNALSQVRMLFAQHAGDAGGGEPGPPASGGGGAPSEPAPGSSDPGGARKPPPGLWVPGQG